MKRKPLIYLSIAIAAVALVSWGALQNDATEKSSPIALGVINPTTGPFAAYGEPVRDGILMAVDEINEAGGIAGREIKLITEDDAGNPKNSVTAFTKLSTVDKVPLVVGPLSSGASMATAPLADRYKVIQLSTLAGTIDLSTAGDYVFRIYPSSDVGSRFVAETALNRFKAKRIAVLYPNNAFGVTSRQVVTEVVSKSEASLVAVETYKDGDRDFRTQLTKIKQAEPDLIICSAYYEEGAQILIQAEQLGLDVPVLGEDAWFGPIAEIVGPAIKNLYFANVAFGSSYDDNGEMQKFISAFNERYGREPNSFAASGHAAVYVARAALEAASGTPEDLKAAMYKTNMQTAF
ncbi:MAG: ABC transporter substrate-binding protein, partial [Oricola sp.]|nr:ABC transporter substrate-binding protein [Oricola sp.]